MLSVSALKAAFGSYYINGGQSLKDLLKAHLVPSETEKEWAGGLITTTDTKVRKMKAALTSVLQPFQKALTPAGDLSILPLEKDLTKMKYETDIDPDELEESYAGFMARNASTDTNARKDWPITKYAGLMMIEKGREDYELNAVVKGTYVAPTPGTPGTPAQSHNGLAKQIADDITAGKIIPINGPAAWSTDAEDFALQLEQWIDDGRDTSEINRNIIDTHCEKIFMSKTLAMRAAKGFDKLYNTNYSKTDQNIMMASYKVPIPHTNQMIVGLSSWNGLSRIVMTPKANRMAYVKAPKSESAAEVDIDGRDITLYADFYKQLSYWDPEYVYCNQLN